MNADEDRIARGVGDFCAHFQRHKIIPLAGHDHAQPFRLQKRSEFARHVERKIFFVSVTADLPFIVAAMSGIQNDRLEATNV